MSEYTVHRPHHDKPPEYIRVPVRNGDSGKYAKQVRVDLKAGESPEDAYKRYLKEADKRFKASQGPAKKAKKAKDNWRATHPLDGLGKYPRPHDLRDTMEQPGH